MKASIAIFSPLFTKNIKIIAITRKIVAISKIDQPNNNTPKINAINPEKNMIKDIF